MWDNYELSIGAAAGALRDELSSSWVKILKTDIADTRPFLEWQFEQGDMMCATHNASPIFERQYRAISFVQGDPWTEFLARTICRERDRILLLTAKTQAPMTQSSYESAGMIFDTFIAAYLVGPAVEVEEALSIIAKADKPVAHVIIEALVVDINTSSIETLGLSLTDGASGKFNAASLIPGQTNGSIIATFSDLASESAQVTATVDFLAARNAAQVLARPYIATRSMKTASISIVDDQFVRVSTEDTSIVSTDSITAGISMEITPAVMADNSIRMDVSLEDSRIGATAGEVVLTKQRNSASTSMIVGSGQTIMIGGLNSRYRITEKDGIPWLRHIPVLQALGGKQGAIEARTQLVVYVTPYIWIPGMDMPMPLQGTPDAKMPNLMSIETGGRLK